MKKNKITFNITKEKLNTWIPKRDVWLCASIIKKDKFEWVVEKATELGVSNIVPIISERTEKTNLNIDRLKKIAKEASEQSERGVLPVLHEPISLADSLNIIPKNGFVLDMDSALDATALTKETLDKAVAIFVGPEGGWTEGDLKFFESNNFTKVSLGEQVLRAETASIAISSILLLD